MFDFSDYPEDSKFFDPVNKKVIGKMKDEVRGKINNELVGLKPNIYYLAIVNNEEIEKAKGAIKILLKTDEKYDDVLFNKY